MGRKSDNYDFSGWATRNDIRCADGLTIRQNAFKDCDGVTVPIVWSHIHDDPEMVLGHALLENHPEGVRVYGKFNDSPKGQQTKQLVESGDVVGLSIWANQLKKRAGDVLHGTIREVSVVLAGANPGAYIDTVMLAHSEDGMIDDDNFEAIITTGEGITLSHSALSHADDDEETIGDVFDTLTDKQKQAVYAVIGHVIGGDDDEDEDEDEEDDEVEHSAEGADGGDSGEGDGDADGDYDGDDGDYDYDDESEEDEESEDEGEDEMDYEEMSVAEVFDTLDDGQKEAVYAILGQAMEDEEEEMKHNVFDADEYYGGEYLSHDDMKEMVQGVMADAKRLGSLKEAFEANMEEGGVLAHAVYNTNPDGTQGTEQTYGVADINWLFPEARTINGGAPEFIKKNDEWVNVVISGTRHTPFSRIKSVFADITNEEARARGYIKGNQKVEEVFSLLKRSTDPQTIYKKQKLDRDDILDITDFDVISWIKGEMRMKLNEEIARAILIGDGRLNSDEDKIKEDHVRPIAHEASLYNITAPVTVGQTMEITAKNIIKAAIRARKDYKGSGSPTLFTSETLLTEMMLLEDGLGHPLYADEAALARRMRVSRIVTCPLFDNQKIDGQDLYGIIVNLTDYNVGADKGGEINMFDDFDIDFNQQKYLIETRISGALIRPYSAITLVAAASNGSEETNP